MNYNNLGSTTSNPQFAIFKLMPNFPAFKNKIKINVNTKPN
jgi:hypothetical protein